MKLQDIDNDAHLGTLCWCQTPSIELLDWRGESAAGDKSRHGINVAQLHRLCSGSGRPNLAAEGGL